jgi:hypothetical protein
MPANLGIRYDSIKSQHYKLDTSESGLHGLHPNRSQRRNEKQKKQSQQKSSRKQKNKERELPECSEASTLKRSSILERGEFADRDLPKDFNRFSGQSISQTMH